MSESLFRSRYDVINETKSTEIVSLALTTELVLNYSCILYELNLHNTCQWCDSHWLTLSSLTDRATTYHALLTFLYFVADEVFLKI